MQVIDVNPLLAVVHAEQPHHAECREWFEQLHEDGEMFVVSEAVILSFVRNSMHEKVWKRPLTSLEALAFAADLRNLPGFIDRPDDIDAVWYAFDELARKLRPTARLVHDMFLAAIAVSHNGTVVSIDRDFNRFPGLRHFNPVTRQLVTNPR